jgi:hypothetical protein
MGKLDGQTAILIGAARGTRRQIARRFAAANGSARMKRWAAIPSLRVNYHGRHRGGGESSEGASGTAPALVDP